MRKIFIILFMLFAVQGFAQSYHYVYTDSLMYILNTTASDTLYKFRFSGASSGTSGAVAIDTLTTTQRDALPTNAAWFIWNSTDGQFQAYDGSSWLNLGAAAGSGAPTSAQYLVKIPDATLSAEHNINGFTVEAVATGDTLIFLDPNNSGAFRKGTVSLGGGGSPGGANTQIQYNNSGAFGGLANFIWNGTELVVTDDQDLSFGTNIDWLVQYDEGVDNQLLFITANTSALATTDPMYEILVGAIPTANQQVFGVGKGTQASNTALFTVDEDGDVVIAGSVSPSTFNISGDVINDFAGSGLMVTTNALGIVSGSDDIVVNAGDITFTPANVGLGEFSGNSDNVSEGSTNLYNQTHTGEVTGGVGLTLQPQAIQNRTLAAIASNDSLLFKDLTDGSLKKDDVLGLKSALSLNLVENTALSTWAGSANLATLGTITSGTWSGTDILDSRLSQISAWSLMLNNSASLADRAAVKVSALTEEATPTTGDWILGEISTGEIRKYNVGNLPTGGGGEANTISSQGGEIALTAVTSKSGVDLRTKSISSHQFLTNADSIGLNISNTEALFNHDNLLGFVSGEHFLQSAITTTGTITSGVWQGTVIDHERGGLEANISAYDGLIGITGGTTYNQTGTTTQIIIFDGVGAPTSAAISGDATMSNSGVLTLGLTAAELALRVSDTDPVFDTDIGSTVQAYDADLDTWATVTPSANGQSLVSSATYATMRGLLDLEAGIDFYSISAANAAFQPLDVNELSSIAGLVSAADRGIYYTGSGTASLFTLTATGRSILDDASTSAVLTTLGQNAGTDITADLEEETHASEHQDGGADEVAITAGMMNAGTGASATTFWRGDNTWATPAGGSSEFTDEGTVLRPSDAADDWLRVSGDAAAPRVGTTDGTDLMFDTDNDGSANSQMESDSKFYINHSPFNLGRSSNAGNFRAYLNIHNATATDTANLALTRYSDTNIDPSLVFFRGRAGGAIVADGDVLGHIAFGGLDKVGTGAADSGSVAVRFQAKVNGTVAQNQIPGQLNLQVVDATGTTNTNFSWMPDGDIEFGDAATFSSVQWRSRLSGATDPAILFGNNAITISNALLTAPGATLSSGTTTLGTIAGTIDATSATRFELPNGTNPTTLEGQIAYDTNNNAIEIESFLIPTLLMHSKTILFPDQVQAGIDNVPLLAVETETFPFGITIVDCGIKTDASSTYSLNFEEWTSPTDGAPSTIELVATSTSTEAADDGTLSDAAIAAGSIVMADLPVTDVNWVQVWFTYTIDEGN